MRCQSCATFFNDIVNKYSTSVPQPRDHPHGQEHNSTSMNTKMPYVQFDNTLHWEESAELAERRRLLSSKNQDSRQSTIKPYKLLIIASIIMGIMQINL